MHPYSHLVIAAKLEALIKPDTVQDYYWSAVAPDIRYLANMRREHTHLDQDRIRELMVCYPHLRSFLSGYQVHIYKISTTATVIVPRMGNFRSNGTLSGDTERSGVWASYSITGARISAASRAHGILVRERKGIALKRILLP